ncbi:unnamed protein product [Vitrella brassicaformis CCMP3155]|uniref:Reverse transcriptase domain-containing protein n=1 Tax=Vitrella brassicaformis (strain CCMP3155) TaxID=1169540 RepID=A0A0G4H3Z8_VITBC|nr:unnamed protein product [Vitrella brassicaformis CCMP3155]|eukprot:CEM38270.1 unnamed protein product [Vitrella brassicaformis CCMP3155]
MHSIVCEYAECFSSDTDPYGRGNLAYHYIDVTGPPPREPARVRCDPEKADFEKWQVKEFLDLGLVRPSSSPYCAPVVLAKKKDGSWRFCLNYRPLNEITVADKYPLPRIDDALDALAGNVHFCCLDLAKGFHQIPMAEKDIPKTAFAVAGMGQFEYLYLPMGLKNSVATCQRFMEVCLAGLQWQTCLVYLDDVCVMARTHDELCTRLREVLDRVKLAGIKFQPKKCILGTRRMEYLGHMISAKGLEPVASKIQAVKDWKLPKTQKELHTFYGLCSYYRRFVPNFATIAAPLSAALSTKAPKTFEWTPEMKEAFWKLKKALCDPPILAMPDFSRTFIVKCDASGVGVGAVLVQEDDDGHEHPIGYISEKLDSTRQA